MLIMVVMGKCAFHASFYSGVKVPRSGLPPAATRNGAALAAAVHGFGAGLDGVEQPLPPCLLLLVGGGKRRVDG